MDFNLRTRWFIRIFALWALVLTILAIANLLVLTQSVELYSDQYNNRTQVWIIFILQAVLGAGFAASTYGLWEFKNWARILFIFISVVWFGFNLVALFAPGLSSVPGNTYTTTQLLLASLRYIVAIIIPVWYFNLPHVKAVFMNPDPQVES